MYRIGLPGWKVAARLGVRLSLRVDVYRDEETHTYWAKSDDLQGLVASGDTIDELVHGVADCVTMLLEECLAKAPAKPPRAAFVGELLPA